MHQPPVFDALDTALQELSETDRELVLRRYTFGETVREMAARIGKTEEACQKRLERILIRLGAKLGSAAVLVAALQHLAATPSQAADGVLAKKIAAGALLQAAKPEASGIWGSMAACLAAAGLASALAWPRAAVPPAAATIAATAKLPRATAAGKPTEKPLKARPEPIARSLADVLNSIHCGRLLPLVEFLPQATEADLRAILREDDMASLSERSMTRIPAHSLAMRHWAAIDPPGAWKYALSRDKDNNGYTYPLTSLVLCQWAMAEPQSPWQAVAALSAYERRQLAGSLSMRETALTEEFISRYPELYWETQQYRRNDPPPDIRLARANKAVEAAMRGEFILSETDLADELLTVTEGDAEAALSQAYTFPDPVTREKTLARLIKKHPESVDPHSLPIGPAKIEALKAHYVKINASMPAEPLLQKAWLEAMGPELAYKDPFRILNKLAEADLQGRVVNPSADDQMEERFEWLDAAVRAAFAKDPKATAALLPRFNEKLEPYIAKNLSRLLKPSPKDE